MYSKAFLLLTAVICVAVAADKKISMKVTPQEVLKLRSIAKGCAEEVGVNPGMLSNAINWTFDTDEKTRAFVYCLTVNAGYVDEDGNVNLPKLLTFEVIKGTKEEFANELNECNKVKKENKIETVFEIGNCIHNFLEVVVIRPSA